MACTVNKTPEEIHNIFKNKGSFFDIGPDTTFEDMVSMLEFLKQNVKKVDEVYWFSQHQVKDRVSDVFAKRKFSGRVGKKVSQEIIERPDNIKRKDAGIRIHGVLAEMVDFLYNKNGNDIDIMRRAAEGSYSVKGENFDRLLKLAKHIIKEVIKTQNSIDPNKKAYISVEQFGVDPSADRGGTADMLVLFSDKSGGIIDYKTSHSTPQNFIKGQLVGDLLGLTKVGDYELNMNEYRRIFTDLIGIKSWRMSRLIPIHVRLKPKIRLAGEANSFDYYTDEISSVNSLATTDNEHLKPIPLQGEITKYNGINKMLENQWKLLNKLVDKRNKKGLNSAERDRIDKQVNTIRKTIQKTIVDGDISDIMISAKLVMNNLNSRIGEEEFLPDGTTSNPKFMNDEELEEAIGELSTYQDIISNTHKYYHELKEQNSPLYQKIKETLAPLASNVEDVLEASQQQREARILKYFGKEYKDKDGNLLPLEEVGFMVRNFTRFSSIDHPVFKVAWGFLQDSLYSIREDVKNMSEDLDKVEQAVFDWAKANNMSKLDAFKLIIDTESGNLISDISPELIDKINQAYNDPDAETGSYDIRTILELANPEKYKEIYNSRLQRYKETTVHHYPGGETNPAYKKSIDTWISQNDLSFGTAWVNKSNRKYLKIKDAVKAKNRSKEYQKIASNKALLDYYNMYIKYNEAFRKMLKIDQYKTLPPNFVANIRKSMVDHLSMDKLNIVAAGKEFFDSLHVREEDVYIGDTDSTGDIRRTIPILFLNPFRNADGDIDNATKSYDLSKNLLIFGRMAFNYKYMSEIEPKIMQLRSIMGNPSAETPGTIVTDQYGRKLKGKILEYATKKGLDTDTYRVFEELTDAYLYGIKFKDSNLSGGSFDTTKLLLKAKQYYGKSTLAFAVIPGAAAYIAGNVSKVFEGSKGISYNQNHMNQSNKHLITDHNKYTALSLFYDVYAEDPTNVLIENKSANFFSKILTYRNLMYPLRKTDELIHNSVLNAMAINWGIDTEGKLGEKNALVRLNRPGVDTTGIKTIWELSTLDKTSGKMVIEGITKENFIAFRNAVKSTTENIIGSLSQDDLSRIDTNLMYNIMFQFKSWTPGIVKERFGTLTYDEKIQAAKWGRYKAAFSEFKVVDTDFEGAYKISQYVSKIFLPNLAKFTLDLMTFGISPKIGLVGETYIDDLGNERKVRTNVDRAKRMYIKYMVEHPNSKMTFDEFLEVKEGQMKAMFNEIRAITLFLIAIHLLGVGGGDDDEPAPYMANWFTRFAFKNFTKAQSELTFMWSPRQLVQLIKNPVPMTGLLTRGLSTVSNAFDESRDILAGENSLSDKTPVGYYFLQWMYGGGQVARLVELYKQYEKSPYLPGGNIQ